MNDKYLSMARAMLELQDEVNTKINPNWRNAGNPWYRAIWTECAELIEHVGWKWWKNQPQNIAQVQLELIDIWHFGLSDILEHSSSPETALLTLQPAINIFGERKVDAKEQPGIKIADVELFVTSTLEKRRFDCELFAMLSLCAALSFDDIYIQYVGKNVLNRFRQDNGYKDGTYVKIWDGREDNEWLVDLAGKLDPTSKMFSPSLYDLLKTQYAKIHRGNGNV
jgi:hypothetical protein